MLASLQAAGPACVCMCARACVRACVCVCVRVCVRLWRRLLVGVEVLGDVEVVERHVVQVGRRDPDVLPREVKIIYIYIYI